MGRDENIRNVEKVIAEEKVVEKQPYKSKIWKKVNPVYELLAHAFVKYINDETIGTRVYNSGKTDEMGELIGIQSLMGRLPDNKRKEVEVRLKGNKSIEEVIDFTALQIAEEKRIQDGSVLHRASLQKNPKHLMKTIRKASPANVYIEAEELERLKKEGKKMKEVSKYKRIAAGILISSLLLGGLLNTDRIYRLYQINRNLEEAIKVVPKIRENMQELDRKYQEKKQEYDQLIQNIEREKRK